MRIEGVDPLVLNQVQSQTSNRQVQTAKGIRINTEPRDQQEREEVEKYPYERVARAVEQVNKTVEAFNIKLRFELNEEDGELYVYVIDEEGKVIRRIPPENILEVASRMQEMVGLIIDALI
ncbi:MAG: flagellar protein FlaG [Thermanaeromonas sp.]|uniref:flagellar protein FlaG n=1 Tax=Thermanaeromonas sp. TaxID=2003697 RepID=UPI00243E873B|nr:flagellar protein FlaG [Thermanaeromonas sp.]MCG0278385.1 flagellar protein FlaG [Thermanaeromonas sp.]